MNKKLKAAINKHTDKNDDFEFLNKSGKFNLSFESSFDKYFDYCLKELKKELEGKIKSEEKLFQDEKNMMIGILKLQLTTDKEHLYVKSLTSEFDSFGDLFSGLFEDFNTVELILEINVGHYIKDLNNDLYNKSKNNKKCLWNFIETSSIK